MMQIHRESHQFSVSIEILLINTLNVTFQRLATGTGYIKKYEHSLILKETFCHTFYDGNCHHHDQIKQSLLCFAKLFTNSTLEADKRFI